MDTDASTMSGISQDLPAPLRLCENLRIRHGQDVEGSFFEWKQPLHGFDVIQRCRGGIEEEIDASGQNVEGDVSFPHQPWAGLSLLKRPFYPSPSDRYRV